MNTNLSNLNNANAPTWGSLTITGGTSLDNGAITTNGAGLIAFSNTLSAANQLFDYEQGYGLWSDNTATVFTGGTTRLWFDTPNNGELHFGGRASANVLAGVRFRANNLVVGTPAGQGGVWIQGGFSNSAPQLTVASSGPSSPKTNDLWVDLSITLS